MAGQRESWKSTLGFVLAAAGSAIGLGNLWRFAYIASQGGGAAFVVLYLGFVALVGVPLLVAEFVVGRSARASCVQAIRRVGGRPWAWLGYLFVFVGFGILSYYSVIMGWTGRVLLDTLRGAVPADTGAYFAEVSTGGDAILFHAASLAVTVAIVAGGIRAGIERASVILLPLLFLLILGLVVWAATLSGAGGGYAYYLRPHVEDLFRADTLTRAAGQAFFSLSLGMGAMLTYASYLESRGNLPKEAATVAGLDTLVAFLGGLVTFPIIYHFGLQGAVGESTVGALFIALPRAFHDMGGAGVVVGGVFFLALYIAALTSAISLLQVIVAPLVDGRGWPRGRAALVGGAVSGLAGIPSALNTDVLGFADQVVGNTLLIFGGLLTAVLVGYVWKGADEELAQGFPYPALRRAWFWLLRIVLPVALAGVLWTAVRATVEMARRLFG
jgi:NSS family neurotransmitter:Na+ symporter